MAVRTNQTQKLHWAQMAFLAYPNAVVLAVRSDFRTSTSGMIVFLASGSPRMRQLSLHHGSPNSFAARFAVAT